MQQVAEEEEEEEGETKTAQLCMTRVFPPRRSVKVGVGQKAWRHKEMHVLDMKSLFYAMDLNSKVGR